MDSTLIFRFIDIKLCLETKTAQVEHGIQAASNKCDIENNGHLTSTTIEKKRMPTFIQWRKMNILSIFCSLYRTKMQATGKPACSKEKFGTSIFLLCTKHDGCLAERVSMKCRYVSIISGIFSHNAQVNICRGVLFCLLCRKMRTLQPLFLPLMQAQ